MSGYNPSSPANLGMEWRPTIQEDKTLSGTTNGLAMRIMPGSTTLDALHPFIKNVTGNPGIGLEVLSTLEPPGPSSLTPLADGTITAGEHHVYGTDTGLVSTGWERQDNNATAANLRGAVDEFPPNTTDYIRNIAALTPSTKLIFAGRGNDTALTGKRIAAVEIVVFHRLLASASTTRQGLRVQGYLNLGGTAYYQDRTVCPADSKWRQPAIGYWTQNPSTNKPWTQAEVNLLVAAGATDEFGYQTDGATVAAEGYNVSMVVMVVFTTGTTGTGSVGDVRKGFLYQQETPPPGWNSFTLGSTSATGATTWDWVHIFPLSANGSLVIPVLKDPRADFKVTTSASATGEHRQAYTTTLGPGGVIKSYSAIPGGMIPILVSAGGTMNAQSQAFAELSNVDEDASATANLTQQITTTASPKVAASLNLPLGWSSATPPTAPFNIQIQHGANAETGAGTVLASIYVQAAETSQPVIDRSITIPGTITPPATTQLYAWFNSDAAAGTGWKVGRADTRSDAVVGPSVANVEGQSQGGQTDSQTYGAVAFDRYDIPIVLMGRPGEIGGAPVASVPVLTTLVEAGI